MKDHTNTEKFLDPDVTASGEPRAKVSLSAPQTLWFNTGTLCNIECTNCYILSSPTNDALVYIGANEVVDYLDQLEVRNWGVREIGFTGGEPFMNPAMPEMIRLALKRGYEVLVLTNAMQPMMRPRVQQALSDLNSEFPRKLTLRVSVDHWNGAMHDKIRGAGSFERTIRGMQWLQDSGIQMTVAGRSMWGETDADARIGYAGFLAKHEFRIDAQDSGKTVIFPEMDERAEVPEITTSCWGILNKLPTDVMCATSRMVVKHKGADSPNVVACTLLPYDPQFDLGTTLQSAEMDVALNHPHCAKFCVLGGASCSA